jgi:hypothetical protein
MLIVAQPLHQVGRLVVPLVAMLRASPQRRAKAICEILLFATAE